MHDDLRVVFGSRLASASSLSETADRLEHAMRGALGGAGQAAATGSPDRPGAEFDAEFAGLTDLVQGAFGATAERLRDIAARTARSETTFALAEQANEEAVNRPRAIGEAP
ncbi:hypothetical protein ABZ297_22825 [Nonomuraea sp. NPDC005983]|uniref:hypothetical protein n=1 Tax=Nonomuraea sp. NPDC005983 TaxID=3155595 RepID=UPI0033B40F5F